MQAHRFDVLIARLFAFVGPYLPLDANYAVGNFLRDVLTGGPIQIAGDGTPFRSYLYAADLAIWLWTMLLRAPSGAPFNVGSPHAVTIAELARRVMQAAAPGTAIRIARQPAPGVRAAALHPRHRAGRAPARPASLDPPGGRPPPHVLLARVIRGHGGGARMIRLSDYVIQFFVDRGIHDVFLASGGGIMHLLDSVGRNPGMNYYCNYHEQACAVSAEGYARVTTRPGLCLGTTGPGAINALSGMTAAWVDSVPLILLAGQVRTDIIADYTAVRQLGPQEGNTVAMARPVTKYAATVKDPRRVRYELECAFHHATAGRPGPVVLEFPLDVQAAEIDEISLPGFEPPPAVRTEPVGGCR